MISARLQLNSLQLWNNINKLQQNEGERDKREDKEYREIKTKEQEKIKDLLKMEIINKKKYLILILRRNKLVSCLS